MAESMDDVRGIDRDVWRIVVFAKGEEVVRVVVAPVAVVVVDDDDEDERG